MSVGRHRRALLKLQTALLVIAVLSPLWVMPLSAPVVSDVVVVMHHDSAVNTAVRTIVANDPHVQVIEYGSLEYALAIHRVVRRVVWVSHGSDDGIVAGAQMLSWRAFSSRTQMTPGKDIVLACDSGEINQYVPTGAVLGFGGSIDAILGGLIASFILSSSTSRTRGNIRTLQTRFMSRLTDLFTDPAAPIFLYYSQEGGYTQEGGASYDFSYMGIYWNAYNIDPDHEVFYDHPDYTYYYGKMGVGPSVDFTIDSTTKDYYGHATGGMLVNHVSRSVVNIWKLNGLAPIIQAILAIGVALGIFSAGVAPAIAGLIGAALAAIGFINGYLVDNCLKDEKGAGWIFYKFLRRGEMRIKIGSSWWIHMINTDIVSPPQTTPLGTPLDIGLPIISPPEPIPLLAWPEPCDGHYIRT
ncbi:MAG: hypothetical protein ACTSYL_09490 [Candidatus Thorarchaeota archaeon]